jgi:solute carrier family 25 (mitochondrial carnitine/acylcarnitine transporter), member 20/29
VIVGLSVPLFSITLVRTTSFSIYEYSKRFYGNLLYHPLYKSPHTPRHAYQSVYVTTPPYQGFFALNAGMAFLAGFTSGAFITVMACPFEFTKLATQIELLMRRTRLASTSDMSAPMDPKGPMQMAREIYVTRGFRGLYSGFNYHFGIPLLGIVNDEFVMLPEPEYISPLMKV